MIKKIFHISDIHIRTIQQHEKYKIQFERFINEVKDKVKNYDSDEIRIVITGDIVHQKINISNEQILITSWFLNELSKISKVVLITGNHDYLEHNTDRVDSLTPIFELLSNPNIFYYKDSGVYSDDNINWVVYSLYQHNRRPLFNNTEDKLYIGLFHGPVQGVSNDLGFIFDDGYDKLNFYGCDLVLCGDIHKRQIFTYQNDNKGYMIGSMIQQDFAETVKHHGYGQYDVEKDIYTFHDLPNDEPYLHFLITDIKDIENGKETLVNFG